MTPRTVVCVADNGLVKIKDGINIRVSGVRLASHPAVLAYPDHWRVVGTVDPETAGIIEMLGDEATLPRLWDRITPMGAEPTTAADTSESTDSGDLPGGFTWRQIEETYRRLAAEPAGRRHRRRLPHEPSRPEVARALGTSTATLKRACDAAGKGSQWPPRGL